MNDYHTNNDILIKKLLEETEMLMRYVAHTAPNDVDGKSMHILEKLHSIHFYLCRFNVKD